MCSWNSWNYKAFRMKMITKSYNISALFTAFLYLLSHPICFPSVIVILFSAEHSGSLLSRRKRLCLSTSVDFCWSKQFLASVLPLQCDCWGVSCSVYRRCGQTTLRAFSSFCFNVCAAATRRDFGSLCLSEGNLWVKANTPSSVFSVHVYVRCLACSLSRRCVCCSRMWVTGLLWVLTGFPL